MEFGLGMQRIRYLIEPDTWNMDRSRGSEPILEAFASPNLHTVQDPLRFSYAAMGST